MSYNPFLPGKAAAAPTGLLTLATVGAVSTEGVTLILPGATEPTQAHYPNFSSSSLASGDSVIISRVSGTWVVMGKAGGGGGGGGDCLPLAGGTMAGAINMNSNKITNLPAPTHYLDAANKNYVDKRYIKPASGIPKSDLASAVQSTLDNAVVVSATQPTATENKLWVDTDASSGTTYQVPTVAEMEAEISSHVPLFRTHSIGSEQIAAGATRTITYTIPSITGYTPHVTSVHIPDTSNVNYAKVFLVWHQSGTTLNAHVFNTSTAQVAPSPRVECLYLPT